LQFSIALKQKIEQNASVRVARKPRVEREAAFHDVIRCGNQRRTFFATSVTGLPIWNDWKIPAAVLAILHFPSASNRRDIARRDVPITFGITADLQNIDSLAASRRREFRSLASNG
jgi:hypothetical protein